MSRCPTKQEHLDGLEVQVPKDGRDARMVRAGAEQAASLAKLIGSMK
ncbi:MAG: hypothetical protein QGG36_21760 [Pirellulaceae bacterium]|nr:hypothetical protein [Pirellulaceae bacterium]